MLVLILLFFHFFHFHCACTTIGTHVCTDVPGEFEWRAGPLAQVFCLLPFPSMTMQMAVALTLLPLYNTGTFFYVVMVGRLSGNGGRPMGAD